MNGPNRWLQGYQTGRIVKITEALDSLTFHVSNQPQATSLMRFEFIKKEILMYKILMYVFYGTSNEAVHAKSILLCINHTRALCVQ